MDKLIKEILTGEPQMGIQEKPVAPTRLPIRDYAGLRQALTEANLPTLLMVYVQYTQDEQYLERFAPFIRSMFSIEPTNIPDELADDLRLRMFELLTREPPPRETALPRAFVRRMMSVCVGEEVETEQVPVLYDQMAFEKPVPRKELPNRRQPPADFRVAVIGAGMSGIAAGIKLDEAGHNYTIVEKNPDFGGTWLENVYPGVAVDTPSHFYSYSFEQNPDWSSYYPKGPEIERYLLGIAEKYGLREKVLFNTRVLGCAWDEAKQLWRVTTASGGREQVLEFNAIINGHGVLNRWSMPDIPGLEDFKGPAMHSAGWDPSVNLRGKRIALIGTGASGAQIATATAPLAAHLTVFQRSRHWVMHNPELRHDVTDGIRFALREIPHFKEWFRFRVYWFSGDGLYGNVLGDPDWPQKDVSISAQNHGAREYALAYLRERFAERPDLLEKMTPDYPIFGKRIVLDAEGGWLDTLKRANVTLETRHIDHIEADALVLEDGTRVEVDVIALATGFQVSPALGHLHVFGRSGKDLAETWGKDEARSYLGIMAPDCPNLFLTLGPNSAPNHAAGVNMVIEAQVNYIIEALDMIVAADARAIEPTRAAYEEWNKRVDAQMKNMVWTHPQARSYYLASNGRNWVSCPFRLSEYWAWTREPDPAAMHFS
jgi:4-hydroxyacetophenone monooxygenase